MGNLNNGSCYGLCYVNSSHALGNSNWDYGSCGVCNRGENNLLRITAAVAADGVVYVYDPNYTAAADSKAAMSGVYLVYELTTPITEQADPYQHVQIIDPNGTEEYVSTSIVPVGHITEYPTDIVAKVNALPKDFSTLIAPTEKTFTATRNYTVNDLLIINNVLYKVTANIANGGTITVNTNVQQTTLGALIKALS